MAALFYTSDLSELSENDFLKQPIKYDSNENIESEYEIEQCVTFIKENEAKRVVLQFPDNLLHDAVAVTELLQSLTDTKVYLSADHNSFRNFDVDEVTAQHVQADLIIHFGKASLVATSKTKTLFVLGNQNLSDNSVVCAFKDLFQDHDAKVFIFAESCYVNSLDEICKILSSTYPNLSMGLPSTDIKPLGTTCSNSCSQCLCGKDEDMGSNTGHAPAFTKVHSPTFQNTISISNNEFGSNETSSSSFVFFVGSENSEKLKMFSLQHPTITSYVYNPSTNKCSSMALNIKRELSKRYYLVEKLKDAGTIGILVGTVGMAGYLLIINHLKEIISRTNRKSYTFVVGKLNPEKLANFPEIDAFVMVACPEQTYIDSSEYYKPIATPYEVEVAYNTNRCWGEPYVFNFLHLLPGGSSYVEFKPHTEESDISMITGELRHTGIVDGGGLQVDERSSDQALAVFHPNSSVFRYMESSYKGLEQKLGETEVELAKDGRSGLPIAYSSEPTM